MKKVNYLLWLILLLHTVTLFFPIVLLIAKSSFTLCCLIKFFKDLSIPIWILFFSGYWLYYKLIINKNEVFRILEDHFDKQEAPTYEIRMMLNKRQSEINEGCKKLRIAEKSIKTLEIAIAISGIAVAIIGIIDYIFC